MTSRTTPAATEKPAGYNVFRKPLFGKVAPKENETRPVIPYEKLSKGESMGIKRLFEALVPYDKSITIDEKLIWEEGFPAFERIFGEKKVKKLKKYFGIGFNPLCKNLADEKEVRSMICELRTIENARYYLHGFNDLLERFANRLEGAPAEMDTITKAKLVRMYLVIFCSYYYFVEEFDFIPVDVMVEKEVDGEKKMVKEKDIQTVINRQRAISLGTKTFYPEVLFGLEKIKFDKCGETTIIYDAIMEELKRYKKKANKNDYKELLRFAELKSTNGELESINATPSGLTYSAVRRLKIEVNFEPGIIPHEAFSFRTMIGEWLFGDLYTLYKVLKKYSLDELDKRNDELTYIDGSRFATKPYTCYIVVGDNTIAGQSEADRIKWLMEYCEEHGVELKGPKGEGTCNARDYMAAIKFATDMGYLKYENSVIRDMEVAKMLLSMGEAELFVKYKKNLISQDALRDLLGINDQFEEENFPDMEKFAVVEKAIENEPVIETANNVAEEFVPEIELVEVKPEEPVVDNLTSYDAIVKFAMENGYVASMDEVTQTLVENVIISGNEANVEKFAAGEIDEETFKKRIGFEEEFAEMYFNLKMVDVSKIESKLLDLKRTLAKGNIMQKSALVVKLYCYLVENEVKCGSKNKAAKRNKSLKPANLRNAIEAA